MCDPDAAELDRLGRRDDGDGLERRGERLHVELDAREERERLPRERVAQPIIICYVMLWCPFYPPSAGGGGFMRHRIILLIILLLMAPPRTRSTAYYYIINNNIFIIHNTCGGGRGEVRVRSVYFAGGVLTGSPAKQPRR
jgi:hypothetical protein